jgi:hypothetical protein
MDNLNLPSFDFKTKIENAKTYILDEFRHKFVKLTPEEFVRQSFTKFLVQNKNYPANLISIEYQIEINKNIRRCDIVLFNSEMKPKLIVECKAPNIKIDKKVFEQIFDYHYELKPKYLIVTNGISHYCMQSDEKNNSYKFLEDIPKFENLL